MRDGPDRQPGGAALLRQLLGGAPLDELAGGLLSRTGLTDGRVEAHEFGMDRHSSASAGGVALGLCGIPALPDATIRPLVDRVLALVDGQGVLRGHDSGEQVRPQSWAMAQVLLGLLYRPELVAAGIGRMRALAANLVALQDPTSGGWPLRADGAPRTVFTVYPVLALERADRLGLVDRSTVGPVPASAARYLLTELTAGRGSVEEQLLASRALGVLRVRTPYGIGERAFGDLVRRVEDGALSGRRLSLRDESVVVYPQPTWHAVLWRPLLYLAVRPDLSPLSPLKALLGQELVGSYDRALAAWRGPAAGVRLGTGVSWASALALRGTYRLAHDLARHGLTVDTWTRRCDELREHHYDFDVVLSFAGADRAVAHRISEQLKRSGYLVFYDRDHQHSLLGEDLTQYLHRTYFSRSRYAVVLVSREFLESRWAGNWEWKAVLARMQIQPGSYLLPYLLENVPVPGLNPTIGYASRADFTPAQFAELVVRKLRDHERR